MKKKYKYHIILLMFYKKFGTDLIKTKRIEKEFNKQAEYKKNGYDCSITYSKLYYVRYKHLLNIKLGSTIGKTKTMSDKRSNWWYITKEGLIELMEVFGLDVINKKDYSIIAEVLLLKNKINSRTIKFNETSNQWEFI